MARLGWRVTQWNDEALLAKVDDALAAYARGLGPVLDTQIEKEQYPWPRFTRRKSGQEVPPGRRDIVDLGNLLRSRRLHRPEPYTVKFVWRVPYSRDVLRGSVFVSNTGKRVELPGRDWITPALREYPVARGVAIAWRAL